MTPLLEISGLDVVYRDPYGKSLVLLDQVCFTLSKGEVLGITGESGGGKSLTALSVMGLSSYLPGIEARGRIYFNGEDVSSASERNWQNIRGNRISMVFQQPESTFNPLMKCGSQLIECITTHQKVSSKIAASMARDLLVRVGLADTERFMEAYPFRLSGGQLQRIAVAMALANKPDIIIADEITSALDTVTASQIIDILSDVTRAGTALIFISHDLMIMQKICDRILVINAGKVTEETSAPWASPSQFSVKNTSRQSAHADEVVMEIKGISKVYKTGGLSLFNTKKSLKALNDVSFNLRKGEMLGVLGMSGSGKSTLAKIITGIEEADNGQIMLGLQKLNPTIYRTDRTLRKKVQYIFQDPFSVFNPFQTFGAALKEVANAHRIYDANAKISGILEMLSLDPMLLERYVQQVSGGQRQRLALARVMLLSPEVIVFDESMSAMDTKTRQHFISSIIRIQNQTGFSGVFISHDPRLIYEMCHNVIVIDKGQIVEYGDVSKVFNNPVSEVTGYILKASGLEM